MNKLRQTLFEIKKIITFRKPQGGKQVAAWGFFWNISGQVGNTLARLVVVVVLARLLDPENFGVLAVCMVIVSFSAIFTELGFGPAIVQKKKLDNVDLWTSMTGTLVLSVCTAFVVFAFSSNISGFFGKEDISPYLRFLSLVFFFRGIGVVAKGVLVRRYEYQKIIIAEFLSYVLGFGFLGIGLAYMGFGTWSLIWAAVSQSFFQALFFLLQLRIPGRYEFSWKSFKELTSYGFGQSLARIANFFTQQGDVLVIGRTMLPFEIGIYRQAQQLSVMPQTIIGNAIDAVAFPTMARAQDSPVSLRTQYFGYTRVLFLLVSSIAIFSIIFSEDIVLTIFGEKWIDMVNPFRILLLSLFFRPLGRICHCAIRATGHVYRRALIEGISGALLVAAVYFGSILWGITGACVGKVAVGLLNTLVLVFFVSRILSASVFRYLENLKFVAFLLLCELGGLTLLRYLVSFVSIPFLRFLISGLIFFVIGSVVVWFSMGTLVGFSNSKQNSA